MKIRPEIEPSCSTRTHMQTEKNDKVYIRLQKFLRTRLRMRRTVSIKQTEEEKGDQQWV